ncbi:MAG: hypothetical protein AAFU85_28725 [Planctomycetota bacterium]
MGFVRIAVCYRIGSQAEKYQSQGWLSNVRNNQDVILVDAQGNRMSDATCQRDMTEWQTDDVLLVLVAKRW